jgi:SIR2-like domain
LAYLALKKSKENFSMQKTIKMKNTPLAQKIYREHLVVYKPHGSLDWYESEKPIKSNFNPGRRRLIITPGTNKYIAGYDEPFDFHREQANSAINSGENYLTIGYGFNDRHLETHLRKNIALGKHCVVLSRSLTEKSQELANSHRCVIAITRCSSVNGSTIQMGDFVENLPGIDLWSVEGFIKGVLE